MSYTKGEKLLLRDVEEEMKESYLRYSLSVIISRALPDARDGLKPSQRRLLYAMRQLSLTPNAKHRKCAKICGDTSGDYHPHGETVIYPTMVRMAQDWIMRYCLVHGQGNFGSIDGDPPAAMRYTEARLTASAVSLMEDLEKETVEYLSNYDETKKEPSVFPAKFPNLLCNGSSGIAVGMATNIPPHNLSDLVKGLELLIEEPKTTIEELMEVIPSPDFPTGGVICGKSGIREAYLTGRGKLKLRGVMHVEEQKEGSDRQRIVVDELPYNVNKARLIERIANLVNEKTLTGIADIRDESGKDGMRIAIDLKKGETPEVTINQLYKFTDMQVTFGCNMLALDKGLPRVMNLKQLLSVWITHRIEVVRARTRFELAKAEARAHLLEGYLKALDHLDAVVKLIRKSKDKVEAKKGLIETYDFTERQAAAVLDLRLYQLTGLEKEKIQEEYDQLQEKIAYYRSVLASEKLVRGIIKEELHAIRKLNPSPRKTRVVPAEEDFEMEDLIANETVVITISHDDYVKRMPITLFKQQKRGGQGVIGFDAKKEGDGLKDLYVASTHECLMIFTNFGRCYWVKVWQLPEVGRRSKGKALVNLLEGIQTGEVIAAVLRVKNFDAVDQSILLITRRGVVKKSSLELFNSPRSKGVYAIKVDENDEVIDAHLVGEDSQIMLFTREGMAVRFDSSQVRPIGRIGRGVRGAKLKSDRDAIVSCQIVQEDQTILVVCEKGYGKRSKVDSFRQTNRGGLGVRSIITSTRNGMVVGALAVTNQDSIILMTKHGHTIRLGMEDLRVMGRSTQGVKVVELKEGDSVIAMQKIEFLAEQDEDQTT